VGGAAGQRVEVNIAAAPIFPAGILGPKRRACAPSAPAPVAIAQTQDRYTDCARSSVEEPKRCSRPSRSRERKISITAASDPPNLDMSQTCESLAKEVLGRDRKECFTEEGSARDSLTKNWPQYSAADKTQCVGLITRGGPPSYVELISCLDIVNRASATEEATGSVTSRASLLRSVVPPKGLATDPH
jgi:hypothetical protein